MDTKNSTGSWGRDSPETDSLREENIWQEQKKRNKEETRGFKGDCLIRGYKNSQIC